MKPRNFAHLEMPKYPVKILKKKIPIKNVYGWDTETYDGKITLIAVHDKDYFDYIIPKNYMDIIMFMTQPKYRHGLNFFFNLKYDMNAFIKSMPKEVFDSLFYADVYKCPFFKLRLMGNKCMSIGVFKEKKIKTVRKTKKEIIYYDTSKFYDIMVFYQIGSLEKTCNKIFKEGYKKSMSLKEGVKKEDITQEHIDYCIQDARACYKLANHLVSLTNQHQPISHYYSPASLAKSLIRKNLKDIYNKEEYKFDPQDKINQAAFYSYQGGRFEILKKGSFKNVYNYDINSAYPYAISQLQILDGKRIELDKNQYNLDALHGFYEINLNLDDCVIAPIKYYFKDLLIYPKGTFTVWISKSELELLIKHNIKFKILQGYEIRGDEFKPLYFVKDLYKKRLKLKKEINSMQLYYKLVLNSLYGIMLQMVHKKVVYRLDTMNLQDLCKINLIHIPKILYPYRYMQIADIPFDENSYLEYTNILEKISLNQKIYSINNILHIQMKKYRLGSFFNPVWGAEITAKSRNMLYNNSIKYQEDILMYATDGISSLKKLKVPISNKLGDWKEEKIKECRILASGIYQMDDINKFRGLTNRLKLQELFQLCHDEYEFISKRPLGLREALPKNIKERDRYKHFNNFITFRKSLRPNIDKKRNWFIEPKTFRDLMNNQYDSYPLTLKNNELIKKI